ncbi:ABC transporter ATP-binding protein [Proteiniclasticum sp. QWL-01]|uniref:ABC transporter ATP-binding protein n=1 Tax=Proteiniclasticum sp. QWL-01 TaxID=3036945 RepID=UPI00240FECB3|nr:ABC transporter ATP-binding protein [Proteiniclasticum sp. QWL-01]WFF72456.1 ABC transporter ATP-binding protein [Proteiniclasticum sp. QWL-01]
MISSPDSKREQPVLETRGIRKDYGGQVLLDDINITVYPGELVSILGMSGSGKTTLFNIISGLIQPEEGQVLLHGREVTGETGHIAYMLQKDLLLPYKTILDNVALPLEIRGVSRDEARAKAGEDFDFFGLAGTEHKYPRQLSGGMRQRAALLRTYLFSKDLALLDEPFSALDTITRSSLHQWYLEVMDRIHLTTLFITHDIDEAILLSDRICLLTGSPSQISREIRIEEPRPRSPEFRVSEEFLRYKRMILNELKNQ